MWDERYSQEGYLFGTTPAVFLERHRDRLAPGATALAIADGEGRNSVFLAQQGLTVTAMDGSAVAVAKARTLADERGVAVDFHVADISAWDWRPAAYDLVVGIFFQFLAPEQRPPVFEGMKQTLRPGGTLLVHGYRPEQVDYGTGGPPIRENMYTEELLTEAFGDLQIEVLESYDAEIAEGTGHLGMSALIDLVATKPA
jgi:cyclopropane fatty-acyl-phospholipid synthase-like methyltransferase